MTEAEELALFEYTAEDEEADSGLSVPLAVRYGLNPFSVLDRRLGHWSSRKRRWNDLGLKSNEGRDSGLLLAAGSTDRLGRPGQYSSLATTSVFDPVLAEIALEWFSAPGDRVLDPFAGGSVRGIVASRLGRAYTGIDLSERQIEANRAQYHIADEAWLPEWIVGDSLAVLPTLPLEAFDVVLSCPPYFDLEVYGDGPRDLSGMSWDSFSHAYAAIICEAADRLKPDTFACWVISDVRDKNGAYRGLVADTINAFQAAGMDLWNDVVIVDPVGSIAVRCARPFDVNRKVARLHQHMLVFVKGSARRAAARLNAAIEASDPPLANGEATLF